MVFCSPDRPVILGFDRPKLLRMIGSNLERPEILVLRVRAHTLRRACAAMKIFCKNLLHPLFHLLYSPLRLTQSGTDSITCGTDN